jgi:hemerythrin-like domain-containing protein
VAVFKNLFSFLFQRGSAEEHVARYVVREHDRGRSLEEILQDRYVQNRLSPEQQKRLLDRPEIMEAISGDMLEAAKASVGSS